MSDHPHYGEATYWDERYSKGEKDYDWYFDFSDKILDLIKDYPKDSPILNIGCGNSTFSKSLYDNGYDNVCNIDISSVVIEQMKKKYSHIMPTHTWYAQDSTILPYESSKYSIIFDKGTLDAILCGDNSFSKAKMMIDGVFRCLKKGGLYLVMTYGEPSSRVEHFEGRDWSIQPMTVHRGSSDNNENIIYYYVMRKNKD